MKVVRNRRRYPPVGRAKEQAVAKSEDGCFVLAVEAVATGETVGGVGSYHADPRAGWFEYGVTVGTDHRGRVTPGKQW